MALERCGSETEEVLEATLSVTSLGRRAARVGGRAGWMAGIEYRMVFYTVKILFRNSNMPPFNWTD